MVVNNTPYMAYQGLHETESLLGDLPQKSVRRLEELQLDQLRTKLAFKRAVLQVAGVGSTVDTYT